MREELVVRVKFVRIAEILLLLQLFLHLSNMLLKHLSLYLLTLQINLELLDPLLDEILTDCSVYQS